MQSNKTYQTIFKFGLLGIGILFLVISVFSWFLPQLIVMNGESIERDFVITMVFIIIGVFQIIIFFLIKNKFVLANMGNQSIVVKNGEWEEIVNWLDVESLYLIQFVYPPLYRIKIKGIEKTFWFNTENHFVNAGGFTTDLSKRGDLIQKKKRELGI
ncbi:hypothetical protein SAMN00777080_0907 [Aquiflexum balticum DSM 16537]|uniref:Uncharacterized protein n=1 Tax=Aquiflexum balticum DSM 16537 TaxID=758820 RepID=A0A1W2H0A6_9BACT|nr:hypothetical protein [Aquiflexum balticum]SMD42360.1 hypothetical protein SAMN00777080_0907 [Aquiflexum balticum DSM 16537]